MTDSTPSPSQDKPFNCLSLSHQLYDYRGGKRRRQSNDSSSGNGNDHATPATPILDITSNDEDTSVPNVVPAKTTHSVLMTAPEWWKSQHHSRIPVIINHRKTAVTIADLLKSRASSNLTDENIFCFVCQRHVLSNDTISSVEQSKDIHPQMVTSYSILNYFRPKVMSRTAAVQPPSSPTLRGSSGTIKSLAPAIATIQKQRICSLCEKMTCQFCLMTCENCQLDVCSLCSTTGYINHLLDSHDSSTFRKESTVCRDCIFLLQQQSLTKTSTIVNQSLGMVATVELENVDDMVLE
jgi:hypothetical protein